jgi:hypothetical protein
MSDIDLSKLSQLSSLAAKVGEQSDELAAAICAEREACATVVEAVVEVVRPALRAMSSKLGEDLRGVVLDTCDDTLLILTEEGALIEYLNLNDIEHVHPISARRAMDMYTLSDCVSVLTEKLTQYANGAAGRTALKARARAERLRALCLLLG